MTDDPRDRILILTMSPGRGARVSLVTAGLASFDGIPLKAPEGKRVGDLLSADPDESGGIRVRLQITSDELWEALKAEAGPKVPVA